MMDILELAIVLNMVQFAVVIVCVFWKSSKFWKVLYFEIDAVGKLVQTIVSLVLL